MQNLCNCSKCNGVPTTRRVDAFYATAGDDLGEYIGVYNECYCPECGNSSGLWESAFNAEDMWNTLNKVGDNMKKDRFRVESVIGKFKVYYAVCDEKKAEKFLVLCNEKENAELVADTLNLDHENLKRDEEKRFNSKQIIRKNIPMRLADWCINMFRGNWQHSGRCPVCDEVVYTMRKYCYCPNCGQKLRVE